MELEHAENATDSNGRNTLRTARDTAHAADIVAERAARVLHGAIDNATDRFREGNEAIVNGTKQIKDAADERIRGRPLTSVALAFGAGMVACSVLRMFRPHR